jgi:hypothetical protein
MVSKREQVFSQKSLETRSRRLPLQFRILRTYVVQVTNVGVIERRNYLWIIKTKRTMTEFELCSRNSTMALVG